VAGKGTEGKGVSEMEGNLPERGGCLKEHHKNKGLWKESTD
jgi:hypothetical protein